LIDLHLVDEGSGAGAPLLLVHGFTGSDLDWADVQPALARDRRVVSYTHRGHAGSPHTAPYTFDALVGDLEALVDELGLAPMHLLGHSMGGVVVLRYALDHPDRVASLVLMDTFAEPAGGMPREWMDEMQRKVRAAGDMSPMLELLEGFMNDARPEVLDRVRHKLGNTDVEAFCALGNELREHPSLVARHGELTMPVTVLVGENDTNLVPAAHLMAERIPGATLVVLPGGHSPQEDDPAAWLRAVGEHLERSVHA
jgi:2-succinyl-6-hydroxy-2,4-cyclohexadiene-1-carboxylate synthase